MKIHLLPVFNDNYIFVLDNEKGEAVLIDPGESEKSYEFLKFNNLELKQIWITHHHHDHIDGVNELRNRTHALVYGPAELEKFNLRVDQELKPETQVEFDGDIFSVLDISGHTRVHLGFWSKKSNVLFCGDTLFSFGCGRIFDGSLESLYASLQLIKNLPLETKLYCTHEYTLANCRFHELTFPEKSIYSQLRKQLEIKRSLGQFTVPTDLAFELKYNCFLKASNFEEFKRLRILRNSF